MAGAHPAVVIDYQAQRGLRRNSSGRLYPVGPRGYDIATRLNATTGIGRESQEQRAADNRVSVSSVKR